MIQVTAAEAVDREFLCIEVGNLSPPEKKPKGAWAQSLRRRSALLWRMKISRGWTEDELGFLT